jgi:hypothetical protein
VVCGNTQKFKDVLFVTKPTNSLKIYVTDICSAYPEVANTEKQKGSVNQFDEKSLTA